MSTARQFLLCDSPEHADVVDHFIMERLRDVDGSQGASWSGIFTDGTRFGVLWANPASALFGAVGEDPSVVIADEVIDADGVSDWQPMPMPEPEAEDAP